MSVYLGGSVWLPSNLVIPAYARADLAYAYDTFLGSAGFGGVWILSNYPGEIFFVPYAAWAVQTGATVANRTLLVQYSNPEQSWIWSIPAPGTVPASTTVYPTFTAGFGGAYQSGQYLTMAVPLTIVEPGNQIIFNAQNWQNTDQILGVSYTRIRIPTGPRIDTVQRVVQPVALT